MISEDQAAVINNAMAVATYNFRHADPDRITVSGPELIARTLGIRLHLTELRGTRGNLGSPTEMVFGVNEAPMLKIIMLDAKAKAQAQYFSYVGPNFNNDLLTQNNLAVLLSILAGNDPHLEFPQLLKAVVLTGDANEGNEEENTNSQESNNSNNIGNENGHSNSNSNNFSLSGSNVTMQDILTELASLRNKVYQSSPVTPVRLGSMSEGAFSPMLNSQASSLSMMGFSAATPIYLEKFTSADVKAFRQKMLMHPWPNPFYRYVHHSLFDYVKGQWNVFAENSTRIIPRFEDSGSLSSELWFDTLEEIVAEIKFDDEGVVAPILQVSANNGLPVAVEIFMQALWKWLHKQERLHSRPSIRQQIVATLDKCPYAKRIAEIHNMRLAEDDPQYPPRKLVSRVNEIITNLSAAGQHVSEFVKFKAAGASPKQGGAGTGQAGQGARAVAKDSKGQGLGTASSFSAANNNKKEVSQKEKDKEKLDSISTATIKCHECGEVGHRRGDRVCKKFDPTFEHKKRPRDDSPAKKNKK